MTEPYRPTSPNLTLARLQITDANSMEAPSIYQSDIAKRGKELFQMHTVYGVTFQIQNYNPPPHFLFLMDGLP
jgi:hypothetical protein